MQRGTIFLDLKFISIIKSGRNGKMKKALVVVDMQKDFISGALGTKEAEAVVDNEIGRAHV